MEQRPGLNRRLVPCRPPLVLGLFHVNGGYDIDASLLQDPPRGHNDTSYGNWHTVAQDPPVGFSVGRGRLIGPEVCDGEPR